MKTIRVSEKAHGQLVAQAAYLTLEHKRKVTLNEALEFVLQEREAD